MGFRSYLIKRLILGAIVLWIVATSNFIIFSIQTGNPVYYILNYRMDETQKEMLLQAYGYYDPLIIKYLKYLRNMFSFGLVYPYFGISIKLDKGQYIAHAMVPRLIVTVMLLGFALIGRIIVGIPIGILAAAKRGRKLDVAAVGISLLTWGVPAFFIQLLAVLFFGYILRDLWGIYIFPTTFNPPRFSWDITWFLEAARQMSLPVLTLVAVGFGSWVLYTRNLLLDALTQDFIATARAKGLSERAVLFKHAFKCVLPPITTMITLAIPGVITGAIITESIFGINGIGTWYIQSLQYDIADYGIAQAVLFIFATLVIICNFIADILYGFLDPRIRVGVRR